MDQRSSTAMNHTLYDGPAMPEPVAAQRSWRSRAKAYIAGFHPLHAEPSLSSYFLSRRAACWASLTTMCQYRLRFLTQWIIVGGYLENVDAARPCGGMVSACPFIRPSVLLSMLD